MSFNDQEYSYTTSGAYSMLDRLPALICHFRFEPAGGLKILFLNAQAREFMDCEPQELNADFSIFTRRVSRDDLGILVQKFNKSAARMEPCKTNIRIKSLDGDTRWYQLSAQPQKEPQGQVIWHCLAVESDIPQLVENDAAEEKNQLNFLMDYAADPIYVCNPDGILVAVNKQACLASGYSENELVGMHVSALDADRVTDTLFDTFSRNPQPGYRTLLKTRYRRKDGSLFPVEITIVLLAGSDGLLIMGIARDVTQQKESEEQLKLSEERYRILLEGTEALISLYDRNGICLFMNNQVASRFGKSADELIGKSFEQLHPERGREYIARMQEVIDQGVVKTHEDLVIFPEGERWLMSTVHPVKNARGEIYAAQVMSHDTTERKVAEEALNASEERFSLFTQNLPGLVFIKDHESRYLFVNQKIADFFGLAVEEFVGKTSEELFPPEKARMYMDSDRRIMETGEPIVIMEEFAGPDGQIISMLNHKFLISRPDKTPLIAGFYMDITARLKAAEELAATKTLLETAIAQSPAGILIADAPDVSIRLANPAAMEILGGGSGLETVQDLKEQSMNWQTIYPDGSLVTPEQGPLARAISDGEVTRSSEAVITNTRGRMHWVEMNAAPIYDQSGKIEAGIIIFQDITERKKAEQARRESEERFRVFFHSIQDAILIHPLLEERLASFVQVNDIACKRYGYTHQEFKKLTLEDLTAKGSPVSYEARGELDRGEHPAFETNHIKKNGNVFPVEITSNLVRINGLPHMMTVARNITQRKRAEEALRLSHERFLTVLDSIDATIYVVDMDSYEVLFMNKFMIETFGGDMTGQTCWEAFRGNQKPCSNCNKHSLVDENGKPAGVCVWQEKKPLTGKWYVNYDRAINWTDGRLVKIQIATDITEFKQMEEELRQAQKMEAIGTLASGIAHDFNNILGIISGYAEVISLNLSDQDQNYRPVEEIIKAAARARSLVRQILTFSRRTETRMDVLDLNRQVREAAKLMKRTLPKMVDISLELFPEPCPVMADPYQMEQLLLNLGSNAAAAMPDGGSLRLTTTKIAVDDQVCGICGEGFAGEYIKLSVSDSGVGIDPDDIDKIFDPFFTTKEVGQGTGLGLSMVFGIVTGHGGHIQCESRPGEGATFSIFLPRAEECQGLWDMEAETYGHLDRGKETILLVDDEASLLDMVSGLLMHEGYKVIRAESGEEALEKFARRKEAIDLIMLDLGMPGMGGIRCLQELKAMDPQVKVLICSGYIQYEFSGELQAMGAEDFLAKPYRRADLLRVLRRLFDQET